MKSYDERIEARILGLFAGMCVLFAGFGVVFFTNLEFGLKQVLVQFLLAWIVILGLAILWSIVSLKPNAES